jgi:hypothetical protein
LLGPESLTGQQFPASALLLPDLQNADFGAGELAVGFTFRRQDNGIDRML